MGFAAWAFLLWDLLATSVNEGVLEGPREGVFWTAAQYRNVYTRFDRQLILYTTHGRRLQSRADAARQPVGVVRLSAAAV